MLIAALSAPPAAQADFGISYFTAATTGEDGSADLLAGSHPYEYTIELAMNQGAGGEPEGMLYSLAVDLPAGMIGNPLAVPRCRMAEFEGQTPHCPVATQVGVVRADIVGLDPVLAPLYSLVPAPGSAAAFGFSAADATAIEQVSLHTVAGQGFLRVSTPILPELPIRSITETLWGVPAAPGHDLERECPGSGQGPGEGCPSPVPPEPLLTLPASCSGPLETRVSATSREEPEQSVIRTALSHGDAGIPQGLSACGALPFDPRVTVAPEPQALSPSGLAVAVELPQSDGAPRASANLRRIVLKLPPGIALNPAAADGLSACAPGQIGLQSAPGESPARLGADPARCPGGSKIGSARIETPLLDHPLDGAIYLATPQLNPFESLFAIYIVIEDADSGTLLKLPGRLELDPGDGQITAVIDELPQLPFSKIDLEFFGGPRATLKTPGQCGIFTASAEMTPSTAPEGSEVQRRAAFSLSGAAGDGVCPEPEPEQANAPQFEAGTMVPIAGLQTPLALRLQREDDTQHFGALDFTLPPGLLAKLAAGEECSDAMIEIARAASGIAQREHPSCPSASLIGRVQVAAGVGSLPFRLGGFVYLAGPYRGAPLSLVVIVPALAGPFDLGTLVVRVALDIDPRTAQLSARSESFPQILQGVPLEVRSLAAIFDRPGFIVNPTSCEPMALGATSFSALGQAASLSSRFQLGACGALGLRPRVSLRFSGALGRNGHPALTAVLRPRPGDANLKRVALTVPEGEFIDATRLTVVCSRPEFAADRCPAGSRHGRIRAWTPLLEGPLQGPVYLRAGPARYPDLAARLGGRFELILVGHLRTPRRRIQAGFDSLPDLPLSRLQVTFAGGRRGLLANSEGLCGRRPAKASVALAAHNALARHLRPPLHASCTDSRGRPSSGQRRAR